MLYQLPLDVAPDGVEPVEIVPESIARRRRAAGLLNSDRRPDCQIWCSGRDGCKDRVATAFLDGSEVLFVAKLTINETTHEHFQKRLAQAPPEVREWMDHHGHSEGLRTPERGDDVRHREFPVVAWIFVGDGGPEVDGALVAQCSVHGYRKLAPEEVLRALQERRPSLGVRCSSKVDVAFRPPMWSPWNETA